MNDLQIFRSLKIQPTDVRRAVLQILLSRLSDTFTIDEICEEKDRKQYAFTKTSVANTLRLLQVRGFLVLAGEKKCPQRGRPELLFRIAAAYVPDLQVA